MFQIIKRLKYYLAIIILFTAPGVNKLLAQGPPSIKQSNLEIPELAINTFNLFENHEILELTIRFDISEYMKNKPDEEYLDALLTYKYNSRDSVNKKIRLRARGNYRYRNCEFPPLRINFKDSDFGFADLDSLKNVKMVTHCYDSENYQSYLMREYLIYRLYNIVTDYSFRVRFLKVNYVDSGDKGLLFEQYAFLIEPLERILYRFNAREIEDAELEFDDIEQDLLDRLSLFQYLVANSDWFVEMGHNLKLIKPEGNQNMKMIPIPYDFDYSGFVNAHYSVPRSDLNLESITDRVYMGPCRSEEEFRIIADEFLSHKESFMEEIRNFEYLDRKVRKELINFIKSFYKLYKNDKLFELLDKECLK
jgi:hypothetical protein